MPAKNSIFASFSPDDTQGQLDMVNLGLDELGDVAGAFSATSDHRDEATGKAIGGGVGMAAGAVVGMPQVGQMVGSAIGGMVGSGNDANRLRSNLQASTQKRNMKLDLMANVNPYGQFEKGGMAGITEDGEGGGGGGPIDRKRQLMGEWNNYVGFLDKKGMRGNAALDVRSTKLSQSLMDEYRKSNPNTILDYKAVPEIQQEFVNYRNRVVDDLKSGKGKLSGVTPDQYESRFGKDYSNFWPEISKVDGWVGSKTSKWMFPTSYMNRNDNGVQTTESRGLVDTKMYEKGGAVDDGPGPKMIPRATSESTSVRGTDPALLHQQSQQLPLYKDQKNTNLLKQYVSHDFADSTQPLDTAAYIAYKKVLEENGHPDINLIGQKDRPYYQPLTNTVNVHDNNSLLAETAHAHQAQNESVLLHGLKDWAAHPYIDPRGDGQEALYHRPGSLEYEAHHDIEKKLNKRVRQVTDSLFDNEDVNADLQPGKGNLRPLLQKQYEEGGMVNTQQNTMQTNQQPDMMDQQYAGQFQQQPVTINVQKGELLADKDGKIIQEFDNPNRFSPHAETQLKEPQGNFVQVDPSHIVVPKNKAARFKKGDDITRKSILRQLVDNQVQDPTINDPKGMAPQGEQQFAVGGIAGGDDPYATYMKGKLGMNVNTGMPYEQKGFIAPALVPQGGYPTPAQQHPDALQENFADSVKTLENRANPGGVGTLPADPSSANSTTTDRPKGNPLSGRAIARVAEGKLPGILQGIKSMQGDPNLAPVYNSGFDKAKSYANQMPDTYNVDDQIDGINQSAAAANMAVQNANTPSARAEAANIMTKAAQAKSQVYSTRARDINSLRASKLQALMGIDENEGASDQQENIRVQGERRMNAAVRDNTQASVLDQNYRMDAGLDNDMQKIAAINHMTKFSDIDPMRVKQYIEDPNAQNYILSVMNAGGSLNDAISHLEANDPKKKATTIAKNVVNRNAAGSIKGSSTENTTINH